MPIIVALLAFVGFFFLKPYVPFPPLPGPDPCRGVASSVRPICNTYCTVQDCDAFDGSRAVCKQLRYNFLRRTGRYVFPCDYHLPNPSTATPTEPSEVDTPTATVEVETPTATVEPTFTETPTEVETETPTPTFTPIDTVTATSTPEGLASE